MNKLRELKLEISNKREELINLRKSMGDYCKVFLGKYYKEERDDGTLYYEVKTHFDKGRFKGNVILINTFSSSTIYLDGAWFYESCKEEITKEEYNAKFDEIIKKYY